MKNKAALALGLAVFCACFSARAADIELELLPKGRPFRLAIADPREIRMGLSFEGDSKLTATIGNYFSLIAIEPKNPEEDWRIHFGIEGAGFFGLRQADSRFPLETLDGLIGVYIEGSQGPYQIQLRYTHISAHLGDGDFNLSPIAYSREFASLRFGWLPNPNLFLYLGGICLTDSDPPLPPWGIQWGGSYFLPLDSYITPFVAVDFKVLQQTPYNPSFSGELGIALNKPNEPYHSFRIFYSYYTGEDYVGQFFNKPLSVNALGIEMQI